MNNTRITVRSFLRQRQGTVQVPVECNPLLHKPLEACRTFFSQMSGALRIA
jgi:hypothetical protein